MELRVGKPKKGKAQTVPRLRVQTQRKFCEERGSFQSEPTQGRCWDKTQRSMFQLQQSGALLDLVIVMIRHSSSFLLRIFFRSSDKDRESPCNGRKKLRYPQPKPSSKCSPNPLPKTTRKHTHTPTHSFTHTL
jgi:hypothetical protein